MTNKLGAVGFINSLDEYIDQSARNLLWESSNSKVENVYRMFIDEVERPLLEVVMQHTENNQTQAAKLLGINRGSLRTKLKKHGLFDYSNCKQETEEQQEIDNGK